MNQPGLSRRDFLRLLRNLSVDLALCGIGGGLYSSLIEPLWFDIVDVPLLLPRLGRAFTGFRLMQISDLHVGEGFMPAHLGGAVDRMLDLRPDALAITGDVVSSSDRLNDEALDATGVQLARLASTVPTFSVLGNHDHWWDAERVRALLRRSGATNLDNDYRSLTREGSFLHFCGVDDFYERRANLAPILQRLPAEGCAILLAHEPDFVDRTARTGRFDLQISGHSHGGQVVLPFGGPVILPRHGRKYPSGLYSIGGMYQYTNRGLGTISPAVRFFCRPEITVFTLYPGTE
jgi:hypothetical protein